MGAGEEAGGGLRTLDRASVTISFVIASTCGRTSIIRQPACERTLSVNRPSRQNYQSTDLLSSSPLLLSSLELSDTQVYEP